MEITKRQEIYRLTFIEKFLSSQIIKNNVVTWKIIDNSYLTDKEEEARKQ